MCAPGASPRPQPGLPPQQTQKPVRQRHVVLERGAALGLLAILAPLLDLEALVELRRGEGAFDIEPRFDQRQRHHQRAGGAGGEVEGRQLQAVIALDGGGNAVALAVERA